MSHLAEAEHLAAKRGGGEHSRKTYLDPNERKRIERSKETALAG